MGFMVDTPEPQHHPPDSSGAQMAAAQAQADEGPSDPGERTGTGLCLSGGGFRAALFHLGAARRLNELGILSGLRTISGVSGGAITANLLADPRLTWPTDPNAGDDADPLVVAGFEEFVAEPLHRLTSRNIRTGPLLDKIKPWRWAIHDSAVRALADELAETVPWWAGDLRDNSRSGPAVITTATEIGYGVAWIFADPNAVQPHGRVGDYCTGHAEPPAGLRLADVVAATCGYPPFFGPMRLDGDALGLTGGQAGHTNPKQRQRLRSQIRLTDGGVYDNLGLEPIWTDHESVLVSDGGGVFRARTTRTLWGELLQILGIATSGGQSTRLRWLEASSDHRFVNSATWGLDEVVSWCYPPEVVELINAVRTDLDAFSAGEQKVLERHGYVVADASVRTETPDLVRIDAPLLPPHPDVADPAVVLQILRDSAERKLFGRF